MNLTESDMIILKHPTGQAINASDFRSQGFKYCDRLNSGPKVIKLFSCSTQLSMTFFMLINLKLLTMPSSFLLNIAEHENFSANKYEIVGIFIFINRKFSCSAELSMKKVL